MGNLNGHGIGETGARYGHTNAQSAGSTFSLLVTKGKQKIGGHGSAVPKFWGRAGDRPSKKILPKVGAQVLRYQLRTEARSMICFCLRH